MKKSITLLLSVALLAAFALPGFAADPTHLMTHGDEFQDALLVGEITEAVEGYVVFDVVRTVNGKPAKSPFLLFADEMDFAVGDGILASVCYMHDNRSNGTMAYRVLKVELKQDKKIKMEVSDWDAGFLEWYVNTGENDLYGIEGSVYRRVEGSEEGQLLFDGEQWHVDSLDARYRAPEVTREPVGPMLLALRAIPLRVLLGFCAAIGLCGVVIGFGIGFVYSRECVLEVFDEFSCCFEERGGMLLNKAEII